MVKTKQNKYKTNKQKNPTSIERLKVKSKNILIQKFFYVSLSQWIVLSFFLHITWEHTVLCILKFLNNRFIWGTSRLMW